MTTNYISQIQSSELLTPLLTNHKTIACNSDLGVRREKKKESNLRPSRTFFCFSFALPFRSIEGYRKRHRTTFICLLVANSFDAILLLQFIYNFFRAYKEAMWTHFVYKQCDMRSKQEIIKLLLLLGGQWLHDLIAYRAIGASFTTVRDVGIRCVCGSMRAMRLS